MAMFHEIRCFVWVPRQKKNVERLFGFLYARFQEDRCRCEVACCECAHEADYFTACCRYPKKFLSSCCLAAFFNRRLSTVTCLLIILSSCVLPLDTPPNAAAALAFVALLAVVLLQPGAESSSLLLRKVPMLVCGQSLCGSDVGGSESDYGEAPLPYDDSFSLSPESYDASESPTMFNGADPSGNSW